MKRLTNSQAKRYLQDSSIRKVNYIGKVDYSSKAEMIGFNKNLSVYLWLVDDSYKVLEVK